MSSTQSRVTAPRHFCGVGGPAAIADDIRRFYGALFHPEVVHTLQGAELLRNFTHKVAGCSGYWTMAAFRTQAIDRIRRQVGRAGVVCGLSGGWIPRSSRYCYTRRSATG